MKILGNLIIIGFYIFLTWATVATLGSTKGAEYTITQKVQVLLVDYIFFSFFILSVIFPDSQYLPKWWVISSLVSIFLFFYSERKGDWIGKIYRSYILPFRGIYIAIGIVILTILIIGSYILAFLTWKGKIYPVPILSVFAAGIIMIIGLIIGLFGLGNRVWNQFIKDRSKEEIRVVASLSFILIWFGISRILFTFWHLTPFMSAVSGIVIILYFSVVACVNDESVDSGLIGSFLCSIFHIISLLCAGALIFPNISI